MKNEKLNQARDLYYNHDYEAAIKEFTKYYQTEDIETKIEAAYFLGKIFSILDYALEEIAAYYDFVLTFGSQYYQSKVYGELGFYFRKHNNLEEMVSCYKKAVFFNPYNFKALAELAMYCLTSGELEVAFDYYKNLLFVNHNTRPYERKVKNDNIAYIGLAMIMIKKNKLNLAKRYLKKVKEMNAKDRENLNKCYANIFFLEEKFDKATIFLDSNAQSKNSKVRTEALEKLGIIKTIQGFEDDAINTLETLNQEQFYHNTFKNHYANYILGYIYYKKHEYVKAYQANMIASEEYSKCLIYALKCAIHIDAHLAVKTGILVQKHSILIAKYRPYLLYLSKTYNIFFPELDYDNLTNKETQLINSNENLLLDDTIASCNLNPDLNIFQDELLFNLIPPLIRNMEPYRSEYSDTYVINYPGIGANGEDYIVVVTQKDTKDIMDVKLLSKTALDYYKSAHSLRYKPLVRNLFT